MPFNRNKQEKKHESSTLAGGFGTRISEESVLKPKPMVEIGDKPILWAYHETLFPLWIQRIRDLLWIQNNI